MAKQMSIRWMLLILLLCPWPHSSSAYADSQARLAYAIKGALLTKIPKFVKWPTEVMDNDQLTICTVGKNPFKASLKLLRKKKAFGKPIRFQSVNARNLERCQLLFFSREGLEKYQSILQKSQRKAILTVSDHDGFLEMGGILHMALKGKKIKLAINRSAVDRSGLKLRAQLYQLARVVTDSLGE
ncbi:YfiR family protein [Magnetococcus sp. PR-3]|uniref:YfiR family protein n=1 Tax=Magnetococcus sp. PR-3 TaxID=3120355 RepID=UPI002FCE5294